MTIGEMMQTLKQFNPETEVVFAYSYGDRAKSIVTSNIDSISCEFVTECGYGPREERLADDGEIENDTTKHLVVIR